MPMRMISDANGSVAAVFCDHCQQRIDTADEGNVEWRSLDVAEVEFTHKQCSDAFRSQKGDLTYHSMELSVFPLRLAYALDVDLDEAQDHLELLTGLKAD